MRIWLIISLLALLLLACGGKKSSETASGQTGGAILGKELTKPDAKTLCTQVFANGMKLKVDSEQEDTPEFREEFLKGCLAIPRPLLECAAAAKTAEEFTGCGDKHSGGDTTNAPSYDESLISKEERAAFIATCSEQMKSMGAGIGEDMCSCMLDKILTKWGKDYVAKTNSKNEAELEAISMECAKLLVPIGDEVKSPIANAGDENMTPELRDSFMGGCTDEIEASFGKEKSAEMCKCMLDKGLTKWGLGEFMKKAMEQGPEVQEITKVCMKNTLGVDIPDDVDIQPEAGAENTGLDMRTTFVSGCVEPMVKNGAFDAVKAEKVCTCMYDKGTEKWELGVFMKKAMEQGSEVQEIAKECVLGSL